MKLGIDFLLAAGNSHGDYIKPMCKAHPDKWAAGFLLVASGCKNGIRAARALAKTGKCPVMRLHGLWLNSHHFTEAEIPTAVKEAKRVARFAEEFPDIKIYFSPWLEPGSHQNPTPPELMAKCLKACRKVLPKKIRLVSGRFMPKMITEIHGSSRKPAGKYIYSYDGKDISKSNVAADKRTYSDAILFFGWTHSLNLRRTLHDKTKREDRKCFPAAKDILEVVNRMR